jgi:plasmid stabilization system protein ParE
MNKVIWSPNAENAYLALLELLAENKGVTFAMQLDKQVELLVEHIRKFNKLCPPSLIEPLLRKCVIGKNYALLYQIDAQGVEILMFFDNRSDVNY